MMLFREVIIPKRLLSLKRDSHYRFSLFTSAVLRARAVVTCLLWQGTMDKNKNSHKF